jgi:hypothetical protein
VVVSKTQVLGVIAPFPEDIEIEDLMSRLYLLARLDIADREIAEGAGLSSAEMHRRAATWRP